MATEEQTSTTVSLTTTTRARAVRRPAHYTHTLSLFGLRLFDLHLFDLRLYNTILDFNLCLPLTGFRTPSRFLASHEHFLFAMCLHGCLTCYAY